MGRYNTISIGSVYLTDTGAAGGSNCKTEIRGLDSLSFKHTGTVFTALDGTPYIQTVYNERKGLPLSIVIGQCSKTVFEALIGAIQSAITNSTTLDVRIAGDTGTFNFNCLPSFPKPVEFPGTFVNERIQDVTLNFVVASENGVLGAASATYSVTGPLVTLTKV